MNVARIKRSEREECAIKLRDFANRISNGDVSYAAIYVMDRIGRTEEIIMKDEDSFLSKTA